MLKKEMLENLTLARIVYAILILVWLIVLYTFGGDFIRLPRVLPGIIASKSALMIRGFLFQYVAEIILVWMLIPIHLIIRSVVRGEAFHPRNPKRLRKVAYGIFLFAVTLPASIFFSAGQFRWNLLIDLLGLALFIVFFGAVVLMIAEVLSKGVKLQEDQKLTI